MAIGPTIAQEECTMTAVARAPRTETLPTGEHDWRDRWVAAYRETWPTARRWAASGAVSHAVETQAD